VACSRVNFTFTFTPPLNLNQDSPLPYPEINVILFLCISEVQVMQTCDKYSWRVVGGRVLPRSVCRDILAVEPRATGPDRSEHMP